MEGDWEGIGNRNNQQQIYPGEISSVHKITKLLDSLAERLANFNELESGKGTKKLGPIGEFRELKFTETICSANLLIPSSSPIEYMPRRKHGRIALKGNQRKFDDLPSRSFRRFRDLSLAGRGEEGFKTTTRKSGRFFLFPRGSLLSIIKI